MLLYQLRPIHVGFTIRRNQNNVRGQLMATRLSSAISESDLKEIVADFTKPRFELFWQELYDTSSRVVRQAHTKHPSSVNERFPAQALRKTTQ